MPESTRDDASEPADVKHPLVIHVALARVGSLVAEKALARWSSADDRQETRRPAGLLCRSLLRGVLAALTHLPSNWRIGKTTDGKPFVMRGDSIDPVSVSISHSGAWSACAVSFEGDAGIDIERLRCDRDLSGIAALAFGPLECGEVAEEGCNRFYAIWTLREAMAKAQGAGLAMVADRKDRVAGRAYDDFRFLALDRESWQVTHRMPNSELSLAIALRLPRTKLYRKPVVRWWFSEP
jgi:phosphopantetheinyl transferase